MRAAHADTADGAPFGGMRGLLHDIEADLGFHYLGASLSRSERGQNIHNDSLSRIASKGT
jgi:hypothetical protein